MSDTRDYRPYLVDIVEAMTRVIKFTEGATIETFQDDDKTAYAVIRALEVVGEAAKRVPQHVREQYPAVP